MKTGKQESEKLQFLRAQKIFCVRETIPNSSGVTLLSVSLSRFPAPILPILGMASRIGPDSRDGFAEMASPIFSFSIFLTVFVAEVLFASLCSQRRLTL